MSNVSAGTQSPQPRSFLGKARRQLQRLLGFHDEVGRFQYVLTGLVLATFKYVVEAFVIWLLNETLLTPFDLLNPFLRAREQALANAPGWLSLAWVVWTLPFLWIAVSMSVRRAVNAGASPWVGLLVVIPVVNLLVMLGLAAAPEKRASKGPLRHEQEIVPALDRIEAALLGVAGAVSFAMLMIWVNIYALESYGASLFFGTPVLMGAISSVIYNLKTPRSAAASFSIGILSVVVGGGVLLALALEGIICLLMAAPLTLPLGGLGGLVGKVIAMSARKPLRGTMPLLILFPSWAGMESSLSTRQEFQVSTVVDIDAPPEQVWETVIQFPELPPPEEWYFRWGIAYPIRGEIFGTGVGAIRHCVFSTGTFVEPITVWDAPRRLGFDVAEQPHPMFELSPYRHVHPPHLDGTLRSTRGEFVLTPLDEGRTRLTGNTWYEFEMSPQSYWTLWSDLLIHRIHQRVLDHVKFHAERAVCGLLEDYCSSTRAR
ncbi:SRPBCC family protein [Planctomicrobium sp. SH661]|uniref:SRPBCC family protein n=1 Tax=Planctomicrobium sp. SH661 TaxID=3448124 RepID=UPI003F5BD1BE